MSESIEDITVAYYENGIEATKELGKYILSKGAWTTIMFRYQNWNYEKQDFGPVMYTIRRYQKRNNQYWLKSKFNISSEAQARKVIEVLTDWLETPS